MPVMNLNAAITFSDVITSEDNDVFSLLHIDKSFPITYDTDGNRAIRRLSLALFLNATESKNKDFVKEANPRRIFVFDQEYQFRLRVTETKSGKSWDLKTFSIRPNDFEIHETPQFNIFKHTMVSTFSDIPLKEKKADESFVMKVLVRPKNDGDTTWAIQAIYPLSIVEWEKPNAGKMDNHRLKDPSELNSRQLDIDLMNNYIEKMENESVDETEKALRETGVIKDE